MPHYAAVESNRRAQAAQPAASTAPSLVNLLRASRRHPAQVPQHPRPRVPTGQNFRGPKRDGKYDETTILDQLAVDRTPVVLETTIGRRICLFRYRRRQGLHDRTATWPGSGRGLRSSTTVVNCGSRNGTLNSPIPPAMDHAPLRPGTMDASTPWAQPASCDVWMRIQAR